ncbi:MAG: SseA [Fusobacteria bacterium]|nr:MAG: SseA [Fusobacteriota bacterium]KAF0228735.1 MAG: hypothetical protein FD182_991 [Fusobacteriota bacterium]
MKKLYALLMIVTAIFVLTGCNNQKGTTTIEAGMKDYYVDASWLKDNLEEVTLIDARSDKEYKAGHIEGAVNITWQALSNMAVKQGEEGWGVVLGKDALSSKLASFGIDKDQKIIIYNDPKGLGEEGRVYWMLKIAGLDDVKMLNGGITQWNKNDGKITTEETKITASDFKIDKYDDSRIATTDQVKAKLKTAVLLDTRSIEEYTGATNHGENYKGEKALGRIPGAISLPYSNLYKPNGTLKSIKEIVAIMDKLGVEKDDEIITYCTVGIRSGFTAEILKMSGYKNVKNYNGSFSEWAGLGNEYEK